MCGIAGLFSHELTTDNVGLYSRKLSVALDHRGPDSNGIWHDINRGVLLSHNRLAINDLSPLGAQPMHSSSGRYVIAFNGEVYNHKNLRARLELSGIQFRGTSDTEVMLAAIAEWGLIEAVKLFSGMFAFALWDREEKVLHLCRDRIGEKPLYYGWIGQKLFFASELSAIESASPPNSLTINNDGLYYLFKFGYIPAPHTIYTEISKLPPSTIASFSLSDVESVMGAPEIHEYWSLSECVQNGINNPITSIDEAKIKLDQSLKNIINQQLSADVNVGLFLSGGIDSTTVAAIAQNISNTKVKTFTIGFPDKSYDESSFAANIAKHLGTEHTTLRIDGNDAQDTIADLSDIFVEPFADSSQIPAFLVSKLAREHVTVCLSGDGGDELFAGYNRYLLTDKLWKKIEFLPWNLRKLIGVALGAIPHRLRNAMLAPVYGESQGLVDSKIQKLIGILKSKDIMDAYGFLSSYWLNPDQILSSPASKYSALEDRVPQNLNFVNKAMYVDLQRYLEGDNLVKTDRASMAVSLETRLPLLNHELIELAWSMPLSMKVKNNQSKWILRQVLAQYVPDNLIDRPKMGFSVPIASWLRNELKTWAGDLIHSTPKNTYLNSKPILRAWNEHQSGMYDHSHQLWTILMFLSWQFNTNRNLRVST